MTQTEQVAVGQEYSEQALADRCIDFLEERAEEWMADSGVQRMFNAIGSVFEKWASQDIMDRFRGQLHAIGLQCHVEGALRVWEEIAAQQRAIGRPLPAVNDDLGRLASTRPISNEEVRDAIEWIDLTHELLQEAKGFDGPNGGFATNHLDAAEGTLDNVQSFLARLSAENDRLSALVAQHEETIRIGQNAAGDLASQVVAANARIEELSAREAEARETIEALRALGLHCAEFDHPIIKQADRWLKAGEMEQ